MRLATSNNFLRALLLEQKNYFFHELAIFWLVEKRRKDTFPTILRHLSPVIFANATVMAFLLLRSSRLNFHCYTQREPTPTQKSARKWQLRPVATSYAEDYEGHSLLQTSFAEPPNSRYVLLGRETETEAERPILTERDRERDRETESERDGGGGGTGTERETERD